MGLLPLGVIYVETHSTRIGTNSFSSLRFAVWLVLHFGRPKVLAWTLCQAQQPTAVRGTTFSASSPLNLNIWLLFVYLAYLTSLCDMFQHEIKSRDRALAPARLFPTFGAQTPQPSPSPGNATSGTKSQASGIVPSSLLLLRFCTSILLSRGMALCASRRVC
jgi:hypothetical protein